MLHSITERSQIRTHGRNLEAGTTTEAIEEDSSLSF